MPDFYETLYQPLNDRWDETGIAACPVYSTPGWERAEAAVREFFTVWGWVLERGLMGPIRRDTWWAWIHILSHSMDGDGHGPEHMELERQIMEVAVAGLAAG